MKFLIASLALIAVASAQQYGQQEPIAILRQAQDISPEGSFNYEFETENGIRARANGVPGPVNEEGQAAIVIQGDAQHTAPDGTPISLSYTADENGFHPTGDHLPVAPAIPAQIQRALDYIAAHPEMSENQQYKRQAFRV